MKSKTDQVFDRLQDYLEPTIANLVEQWNLEDPGLYLEIPREWDRGYRDILAGSRSFPAVLFIERSREQSDSYTTQYSLAIGFAFKGSDPRLIESQGNAWKDIWEDALTQDHHLGETCQDSSNLLIETDLAGGIFLVSCLIDLEVDRGGFI
jgi:hypothetical protein